MKYVLFYIIFFFFYICFGQESKCSDFRNGTFEYLDLNENAPKAISIRYDSLQIDSYPEKKLKFTSKLRWLTECRYELECISVNDSLMKNQIGEKVIVQIIKIDGNKAFCHYELEEGIIREFVIIKIK
jgi:hypothetical protein